MRKNKEIKKAINAYLTARRLFLKTATKYPGELAGNDNIIGRIGEYIGIKFLQSIGQNPQKASHSNNQGFDLIMKDLRIQVKIISPENKLGRNVRLKEPWDELLLIKLDTSYKVEKIGLLTKEQFDCARNENDNYSERPYVKSTMLNEKGLIGRYGKIWHKFEY